MKRGIIHLYKIDILFLDKEFEHDIYELIRAFYPESEITSSYEEKGADCDLYFRISLRLWEEAQVTSLYGVVLQMVQRIFFFQSSHYFLPQLLRFRTT